MTLGLVMIGWVIFRAESLTDALAYFSALVNFDSLSQELPDHVDEAAAVALIGRDDPRVRRL